MTTRYAALAAALLLASCLATPLPGLAAGGPPIIVVDEGVPGPADFAPEAIAGVCTLQPGPIAGFSTSFSPNVWTSFAWRIPLSSCTACPAPQNLQINSVAIRVRWFNLCSAQAEVSIVGATGPSTCRVPDPTNVLCGPATSTISFGGGPTTVLHTLPLPSGCCVTGEAFALVRFTGFASCGTPAPGIVNSTALCASCDQYFTASHVPSQTDWCPTGATHNSLWMEIDADCCMPTGIGPHSWGTIKTLYR